LKEPRIKSRRGGKGPYPVRGKGQGTREPARVHGPMHVSARSGPFPCSHLLLQRQPAERGDLLHRLERRYARYSPQLSFLFCSKQSRSKSQGGESLGNGRFPPICRLYANEPLIESPKMTEFKACLEPIWLGGKRDGYVYNVILEGRAGRFSEWVTSCERSIGLRA
jgi:hypothetical protein